MVFLLERADRKGGDCCEIAINRSFSLFFINFLFFNFLSDFFGFSGVAIIGKGRERRRIIKNEKDIRKERIGRRKERMIGRG